MVLNSICVYLYRKIQGESFISSRDQSMDPIGLIGCSSFLKI